mgnify:CR=1 FL=1
MSIVDDIRNHADKMELAGVNFYDKKGRIARQIKDAKKVKLWFVDGKEFLCTMKEFSHFDMYQFKLRPAQNNS